MSFLYPRKITITRPAGQAGVGSQTRYAGDRRDDETEVATDLRASIQLRREGQKAVVGLPGDGTKPSWDIFIPRRDLARGNVSDRDIVTDDTGFRYQVLGNYWDSLGYRLRCETLEA